MQQVPRQLGPTAPFFVLPSRRYKFSKRTVVGCFLPGENVSKNFVLTGL